MDLLDLYRRSLADFLDKVQQVRPDQWDAPTPCSEWNVRDLVNHVVYEQRWSAPLFGGATIAEVGDRFEGDLLGTDPIGSATDSVKQAEAAVSEPGVVDRTVHLSFGETPAAEYMSQLLADHLIHGWDVAAAIGSDRTLDPLAVREAARWFADREQLYRQGGAVGPRVDVGTVAGDQDQLLAAFGRKPDWSAGS